MQNKRSTLRAIKYDHRLWDHPERWPHDPPNYVFLARAFQEIGRAKYGEQWTDSYIEPEEPPEECDDAAEEQYELDCENRQVKFEEMRASTARTIAEQSESGNLVTAVRHAAGGEMHQLKPCVWNTENFGTRFFRCQMSFDNPFSEHYPNSETHWIYVQQKSLRHVSVNIEDSTNHLQRPVRNHKLRAIEKVIVDLYGFPPQREHDANQCYKEIRKEFGKTVSDSTIRRAFQRLRQRNTK
jgi:hypothetical protein